MKNPVLLPLLLLLIISCKSEPSDSWPELSLLSQGLPVSIKAPAEPEIIVDDLGFWKDVTIKKGEDYFIQIISSDANTLDPAAVKSEQLAVVKQEPFFSKIVQEDEYGFIYEKQIDENTVDFDFRYVKIVGNKELKFQTGLFGTFNESQVRDMYQAVQ